MVKLGRDGWDGMGWDVSRVTCCVLRVTKVAVANKRRVGCHAAHATALLGLNTSWRSRLLSKLLSRRQETAECFVLRANSFCFVCVCVCVFFVITIVVA